MLIDKVCGNSGVVPRETKMKRASMALVKNFVKRYLGTHSFDLHKKKETIMETVLTNQDVYRVFEEFQEVIETQEEIQYSSHDGADYLYFSSEQDRIGAQSRPVFFLEFLLKANKDQLIGFQKYFVHFCDGKRKDKIESYIST